MKTKPLISICIAVADDYKGLWATIQSLRINNDLRDVQFVIVNNMPNSPGSKELASQVKSKFNVGNWGTKHIDMPSPVGTCPPRQRAIEEADGEWVIGCDAHVEFHPSTLSGIRDYIRRNPHSRDLCSGPFMHDDLQYFATHFADVWGGSMRGKWATAWERPDGKRVSTMGVGEEGQAKLTYFGELAPGNAPVPDCPTDIKWTDHHRELTALGWRMLGFNLADEFEIPCQGLGFFFFRAATWPGFHPEFKGFGGGEWYVHELYRRAGGRAMCCGFARWTHRTERGGPIPYQNRYEDRARNYVLGYSAGPRGLDLPDEIARLREHWLGNHPRPLLRADVLDAILADPIASYKAPPAPARPQLRPLPSSGPGHELKAIYSGMGITQLDGAGADRTCGGCVAKRATMDVWDIAGCRQNFWTIVGWMKDTAPKFDWLTKMKAAALAAGTGLAFKIDDWSDPFPSLVKLAIDRAEAKEKAAAKENSACPSTRKAP